MMGINSFFFFLFLQKNSTTMAKGAGKSEDWACCEQLSYCFTIFVGILFFLAGGAMAVYSALFLWSDFDVSVDALALLDTEPIQYGMFVGGLAIAFTALLGMIMAGCAKCAANPDGKNDGCEKCCTAILSIVYIIILSILLAGALVIAGVLSYYAVQISTGDTSSCPYPSDAANTMFVDGNPPDAAKCPIDLVMYGSFYGTDATSNAQFADAWLIAQNTTFTCGYFCNADSPDFCTPTLDGGVYAVQTTGSYCPGGSPLPSDKPANLPTVYQGVNGQGVTNEFNASNPSTMPYRPTFIFTLNNNIVPFLAVWWCIFVFALLLVVAACAMCIRKKKTTKESTYAPSRK